MAVVSMNLGVWSWSRQSTELQTECQNGKERWFKQLKHGCPNLFTSLFAEREIRQ